MVIRDYVSLSDDEIIEIAERNGGEYNDFGRWQFDATDSMLEFAEDLLSNRFTHQKIADALGLDVDYVAECLNKQERKIGTTA